MKEKLFSKKVLISLISNWQDMSQYYNGNRPDKIPITVLYGLIDDCPSVGEDYAYIRDKRNEKAFIAGEKEILNKFHILVNETQNKIDEETERAEE